MENNYVDLLINFFFLFLFIFIIIQKNEKKRLNLSQFPSKTLKKP
jgi:hypothetical protein